MSDDKKHPALEAIESERRVIRKLLAALDGMPAQKQRELLEMVLAGIQA